MRSLRPGLWIVIVAFVFAAAILAPHLGTGLLADTSAQPPHIQVTPGMQPTYSIKPGIDGEIFPALANYASLQSADDRVFGSFVVTVTNPSSTTLDARISLEVPGWSDLELQNVTVKSGERRKLIFAPAFLPRFYANHEIKAATAIVNVTDPHGRLLHAETVPVRLRSIDDMYWGPGFKFAPLIASWVTPHDPEVERILTRAKEFMPGRRLPGYEEWKTQAQQRLMTIQESRAIYEAVQQAGVSYVKSSITFGHNSSVSERVRMPGESLHQLSANCIDGVVMYASLFENLGMDPVVVLVPGHAYVGVRDADHSDSYIYLETAITGRAPFDRALRAATNGIARVSRKDIITIPISDARMGGVYPMPLPDLATRHVASTGPASDSATTGR